MNITSKQLSTIFITLIFFGSSFAFALNYVLPQQTKEKKLPNVVEQPISDSQRKYFIDNDITMLSLFYTKDNKDSAKVKEEVENLAKEFDDKLIVEEIDARVYQSFSAGYNIRYVPTIIIRGKANSNQPIRVEEPQEYSQLKNEVCSTYKDRPKVC
ncbi:MAG: hypothetical protein J7K87_04020 [Candidatus Aenigmarchaeota archaeon]|nr:hypothetical protein [Candidatus Aenigmarchaeota archaeon]